MTNDPTAITIAKRHDVVLVVGQGDSASKLKVNSEILRQASPVFDALLGPNFAEGRGLSFTTPKEVNLPDDDPKSMQAICEILHFRKECVRADSTPAVILDLARLVDKYALHKAISSVVNSWFCNLIETNASIMLDAAILLDNPSAFEKVTRFMISEMVSCSADDGFDPKGALYYRAIIAILTRRGEHRMRLNHAVYLTSQHILSKRPSCPFSAVQARAFLGDIEKAHLTPLRASKKSVLGCISEIKGDAFPKLAQCYRDEDRSEDCMREKIGHKHLTPEDIRQYFIEACSKIESAPVHVS